MNKFTRHWFLAVWGFFIVSINAVAQQEQHMKLNIETLPEAEGADNIERKTYLCDLGDIVFTIKSNIPDLVFESSAIDFASIPYDPVKHIYVFCHKRASFWLKISSPRHIVEKIPIDPMQNKYVFKITEKVPDGKIFFDVTPKNSYIDFGLQGESPSLSGTEITKIANEYNVRVYKYGFVPVDTIVSVPSDGSTRYVQLTLKEDFAKIAFNVSASDNSAFLSMPIIAIDTARINMGDLDMAQRPSFDDVTPIQYFKLYSEGVVPVPPGRYNIAVNVPGYKTYNTAVVTAKGSLTSVIAKLDPFTGSLTVLDDGYAEGASVFLDDREIGKIPLYKYKTLIGQHSIRIEKTGLMSEKDVYKVLIENDRDVELQVSMSQFKQVTVITEPSNAEVFDNGVRMGFSPCNFALKAGEHFISVAKTGYLTYREKIVVSETGYNPERNIELALEKSYPLWLQSEKDGLAVVVKRGKSIVLAEKLYTPAKLMLPYGTYDIRLLNVYGKRNFKGNVNFSAENDTIKLPCYSKGTFTVLLADYYCSKPQARIEIPLNGKPGFYYTLLGNAQFGRFNLFPGLSTSIGRFTAFSLNEDKKTDKIEKADDSGSKPRSEWMFNFSVLFTNYEFRAGGSIVRNLDVCAMGAFAYYPRWGGLIEGLDFNYFDGIEGFIGVELATRISVANVNIKIGKEFWRNGNFNYQGIKVPEKFTLSKFGITMGVTLGRAIHSNNNMVRIWNKPLVSKY